MIAHDYLIQCDYEEDYWNEQKVWSLSNIAYSYQGAGQYDISDSLFMAAANYYRELKGEKDSGIAEIYNNMAASFMKRQQFWFSNKLFRTAYSLLKRDSINRNDTEYKESIKGLIFNYLSEDSLVLAGRMIQEGLTGLDENSGMDYCEMNLYQGLYYYKYGLYQKADSFFLSCMECYEKFPEYHGVYLIYCNYYLGFNKMELAQYGLSAKYLDQYLASVKKLGQGNKISIAHYLFAKAELNQILGKYQDAKQGYKEALEIYKNQLGDSTDYLLTPLIGLAQIEVVFGQFDMAEERIYEAYNMATHLEMLERWAFLRNRNKMADVFYQLGKYSEAMDNYEAVLDYLQNWGYDKVVAKASALNGIGLIQMAKGKYHLANSFLNRSLDLNKELFFEDHPFIATNYLNLGNLRILEKQYEQAEEYLQKSLRINKRYFKEDHDVFGDIYEALGRVSQYQNKKEEALSRYQKSLSIYQKSFNDEHWKIASLSKHLVSF